MYGSLILTSCRRQCIACACCGSPILPSCRSQCIACACLWFADSNFVQAAMHSVCLLWFADSNFLQALLRQVLVDLPRTCPTIPLFQTEFVQRVRLIDVRFPRPPGLLYSLHCSRQGRLSRQRCSTTAVYTCRALAYPFV